MKTKKEIIAFKRLCQDLRKELDQAGVFTGNMAVRGFLDALDWVLMPSREKMWKKIEKKLKVDR